MGPWTSGGAYQDALARGYRVGAMASGDSHAGFPGVYGSGLIGVWADALTRDAIWDAFCARRVYGINVRRMFLLSLILGGALAGLAGSIEVAGVHQRLIEGLQSNFLILGIIIGLIARGNNLAVPFVAFFIAVLEVGASAMQRTMMIPGEMVFIVEALILLFVLLSDVVRRR